MSQLTVVQQSSTPSTPSAGDLSLFANNATVPQLKTVNPAGTAIALIDGQSFANNASVVSVSGGYASDTYVAGSSVTVVAGNWKIGATYYCVFDMVKTGAGTATPIITVRMGTLGTTGDASIVTITFAVGTGVIDTGTFEVWLNFRTVGSGTSAVIQAISRCTHALAATGLTTTGASGTGVIIATSSGFNSTTQTTLGISFNGGSSFSGTNTLVQSQFTQS